MGRTQGAAWSSYYLTNYSSKTNQTSWTLLKQKKQMNKERSSEDFHSRTHQGWLTIKELHLSALCEHYIPFRLSTKSDGR